MRLIILAAGQGTRLQPLTEARPKCLVPLAGRPWLEWQLEAVREAGIAMKDVVLVGGYRAEQLRAFGVDVVVNPAYATTNMVQSLFCADALFGDACVVSYGDILYTPQILQALLANRDPVAVVVDRQWRSYWQQRFADPLQDAESLRMDEVGRILSIGQRVSDVREIQAQYIGLTAFRGAGIEALRTTFASARAKARLFMTDLLQHMIDAGHAVSAVPVDGGWLEVDSLRDLELAERLMAQGRVGRAPRLVHVGR